MRYLPPTNDTLIPFGNWMPVLLDCLLDIAVCLFQTERGVHGREVGLHELLSLRQKPILLEVYCRFPCFYAKVSPASLLRQ